MIKKLPFRIRFKPRQAYGVNLVSGFPGPLDGTCNPNTKEIKLRGDMSERATLSALTHEILHLISFEWDLELTESQVLGLEEGLIKILELNPTYVNLISQVLKRKYERRKKT